MFLLHKIDFDVFSSIRSKCCLIFFPFISKLFYITYAHLQICFGTMPIRFSSKKFLFLPLVLFPLLSKPVSPPQKKLNENGWIFSPFVLPVFGKIIYKSDFSNFFKKMFIFQMKTSINFVYTSSYTYTTT